MFSPITKATSAADRCAEAIRERILSGQLAVGTRLPAERELAAAFGVNRLTLRAALTALRAGGLVAVKQGSGYTVLPFESTSGPALLPAIARGSNSVARRALFSDLLLIRRHLAAAALSKLATLASPVTAGIEARIHEFGALAEVGASAEKLAAADVAIVAAILDATDSLAFRLILNPLSEALDEIPDLQAAMYREPKENARAYLGLLAWLKNPSVPGVGVLINFLEARDQQTISLLAPARRRSRRK